EERQGRRLPYVRLDVAAPDDAVVQGGGLVPAALGRVLPCQAGQEELVGPALGRSLQVGPPFRRPPEPGVGRGPVLVQRPVAGARGEEALQVPQGGRPLPAQEAVRDAVTVPVEQPLGRAPLPGPRVLGGGGGELAGQRVEPPPPGMEE